MWLQDGCKLTANLEVIVEIMTSLSKVFWRCRVFPVNLSSLIAGQSFMSILWLVFELWQYLFIKDWPEIRKSDIRSVWVLTNIEKLGWVRDTRIGKNVSNKMLLKAAKYQGYNFYHFWVTKGKNQQGLRGY